MKDTTKYAIGSLFDELLSGVQSSANKLSINEVISKSKPLTIELFSDNIDEYIYFMVAQRVTKSFSTRLGKVVEKVSMILVESQGGQILDENPNPFDLKFLHPNGKKFWVEIKSINAQNSSNKQTIKERKLEAEKNDAIFRLCMYNDDNSSVDDYKLNGEQFWTLVGGHSKTKEQVYKLINGVAKNTSIKKIIEDKTYELLKKYKKLSL